MEWADKDVGPGAGSWLLVRVRFRKSRFGCCIFYSHAASVVPEIAGQSRASFERMESAVAVETNGRVERL